MMTRRLALSLLALSLLALSAALTEALSGHAWQTDRHMAFFAFLACLVSLRDTRTIISVNRLFAKSACKICRGRGRKLRQSAGTVDDVAHASDRLTDRTSDLMSRATEFVITGEGQSQTGHLK